MANEMRGVRIEKVTLNIGVGEGGEELEKASRLLNSLTGQEVQETLASKDTGFDVSEGRPVGVKVTLRGEDAETFLRDALEAVDNTLPAHSFDSRGNISFGISEHIDIPEIEYDPSIGIFGMDISITFERPGFRVKRRAMDNQIGKTHQLTKQECMDYLEDNFGVDIDGR